MVRATVAAIGLFLTSVCIAQTNTLSEKIHSLRSLPDDKRAIATRDLAKQIGVLPLGEDRLGLAANLVSLSTEGDFGRDTLQQVTNLVVSSMEGVKADNPMKPFLYSVLAELVKYEGMQVKIKDAAFRKAQTDLDQLDKERDGIDFTLTDIKGETWTRSKLKGKVVLVNFWATWCPPCRKEMPDIDALAAQFESKGFVVLAISDEPKETVEKFVKEKGYAYHFLLDPGRKVNTLYHIQGIPKSFIYGRDGHLVAQTIDMRTKGQFLKLLAKAGLH